MVVYSTYKPQVSVAYRLSKHVGCWKNTRRIRKLRARRPYVTYVLKQTYVAEKPAYTLL